MVNDEGGKTACSDATCLHKETHLASELTTGLIATEIGSLRRGCSKKNRSVKEKLVN